MDTVTPPTGNPFFQAIGLSDNDAAVPPTSVIIGSGVGVGDPNIAGNDVGATNAERANFLFPFFDGVENKLVGNPVSQDGQTEYLFEGATRTTVPAFDADGNPLDPVNVFPNAEAIPGPDALPLEDFFGFHSAHQLEYVNRFGTVAPGASGAKVVTFIQGTNRFDIVAAPDGKRTFVLQQLTKADLAIVGPETEQALSDAVAGLPDDPPSLRTNIESVLGAKAGDLARAAVQASVDNAKGEVNALFSANASGTFSAEEIAEFKKVFTDQLDNIQTRANESSFFAQAEINTRIEDITRRAKRANAFFETVQNPPAGFLAANSLADLEGGLKNVNLPVGDDISQSGLRNGLDSLIAQETRIRDLDNQRLQLAQSGLLNAGRALDGPSLIAIFQLNYNLTREAEVNAETEELNQQNALLQVYARAQQLLNDALRTFNTGTEGSEEERTIFGETGNDTFLSDLTDEQRFLVAFIEEQLVEGSDVRHPIEELRGINRPTLDVLDDGEFSFRVGLSQNFSVEVKFNGEDATPEQIANFEAARDNPGSPAVAGGPLTVFGAEVLEEPGRLKRFSQNALNIFASQLADTVTTINQESQILTNEISNINRERNRNFDLANNALRRLNDTLTTIARS